MELRKSYIVGALLLGFFLIVAVSCKDQGNKYSYGQVSASAYGQQTEAAYGDLLQRYVEPSSLVRYSAWLQNAQDIQQLKSVLDAMSKADDSAMSPDQRKAFFINAYNAMTLDLILSHYQETLGGSGSPFPDVRSIRNISNLDTKVWDRFQWQIAGKIRSLNDVEHRILRPLGDARIHFSIVCASLGCPPLYNHALTASNIDSTLDRLSEGFVNSGRNTVFDQNAHVLHTSQILSWFGQDFVKSFGSLQGFFVKYAQVIPPQEVPKYSIKFDDYDWTLNESQQVSSPTPTPSPSPGSGTEREIMNFVVSKGLSPTPSPSPSPGSGTEREILN